jgi:hypothetical protein
MQIAPARSRLTIWHQLTGGFRRIWSNRPLNTLDTNVCIQYLNGRSLSVRERLHSLTTKDIAVCSVVKSELFYGSMRSNNPSRNLEQQKKFLN